MKLATIVVLKYAIGVVGFIVFMALTAVMAVFEFVFMFLIGSTLRPFSNGKKPTIKEIFTLTPPLYKASNLIADWAGID